MESAGWMRSERTRMRRKREKWSRVRVLVLLLKGRWRASEVGVSELWIKVSESRMEKLVFVS